MKIRIPVAKKDFSWARWGVEDMKRAAQESLARKKTVYREVKRVPASERTFANTVYAIEATNHDAWKLHGIALLMNVSPEATIREAAKSILETTEKRLVDLEYDAELAKAVESYARKKKEITRLSSEEKKLLADMRQGYRRMGLGLPMEKRRTLKKNLKRLSELSMRFSKNINDYDDAILVTEEELAGLPAHYIAGLRKSTDGTHIVSLAYPDALPYMENAHDAARREELAVKYLKKGGQKNIALAEAIIRLRYENARLLGYRDHAQYRVEVKMAKTPKRVQAFLSGLVAKVEKGVRLEMDELARLKRRQTGDAQAVLRHFDTAYYANLLKKEKYAVDNEAIREYFPIQKVLEGMFEVYETLFSVRFEKASGIQLWHPDVLVYRVTDRKSSKTISYFGLDLHPREGKYGHAAAFNVVSGRDVAYEDRRYVLPFACLVTNFPKPGPDRPSLLSHDEVNVFFHEFGHIMHEVLTEARFVSQAGFSTAWDFVEAPSQMFENWVWNARVLAKLSGHYQTGKPLPQALLQKMLAAKNHLIAHWTMRQLAFALYDMELHTGKPKSKKFLLTRYHALWKKYIGTDPPKDALFLAGFGHFNGYDAGYYGYLWSLVYASDMFTRFEKEGLLNAKTGNALRKEVLERGSSVEEMAMVKKFLGRAVSQTAFLREIGLK